MKRSACFLALLCVCAIPSAVNAGSSGNSTSIGSDWETNFATKGSWMSFADLNFSWRKETSKREESVSSNAQVIRAGGGYSLHYFVVDRFAIGLGTGGDTIWRKEDGSFEMTTATTDVTEARLNYFIPVPGQFALFGEGGGGYYSRATGAGENDLTGFGFNLGLGVQRVYGRNRGGLWGLEAEYFWRSMTRTIKDAGVDQQLISMGLLINFRTGIHW